jgi:serine/threonine protein kinase
VSSARENEIVNPEEWARARDLFDAALERPAEERGPFLDEACAGHPALRAEVASLLAAYERAPDFIERPAYVTPAGASDGSPKPLLVGGQVVGPYVIRHEIGRGGMGVVYLADDTRLSRRIALKALGADVLRDPHRRERLRQEARAAAGVSHPGIATVYALEEIGEDLYLACEYVPGPTLRSLLDAGPLPMSQVVQIGLQLARALAAAHAQGIVHCDLKPENIVRTTAGLVKVLDFGIARVENLTAGGPPPQAFVGTPGYMAPEQIRGDEVDFRADVFALGVILYEMASGSNPFEAGSWTVTRSKRPMPPRLNVVLSRCLGESPAARYGSTPELVADLERLEADVDGSVEPVRTSDARWWWQFHQIATSMVYVLVMYPAWQVRLWLPPPWGTVFLLASVTCAAAATTERLHLWFTSRFYQSQLSSERAAARYRLGLFDAGLIASLLAAGLAIASLHQAVSMLFAAVGVSAVVASAIIEPSAARAAFPVDRH